MRTPYSNATTTPLVSLNPDVMGGRPVFVGTRVPIDIVVGSLDEGSTFDQLREAWPFLSEEHVRQARAFLAANPAVARTPFAKVMPQARLVSSNRVP